MYINGLAFVFIGKTKACSVYEKANPAFWERLNATINKD